MSGKIDFRTESSIKDEKGDYVMIKKQIHQEEISILNIYVPNKITPKYMKEPLIELQEETNESIFLVRDFNIYLDY